ncbi:uncharacterized protein LOC126897320 [Daktulosphaira vitifoliae]|uniref:uncharacterized protein LOC126897320 n=1 Tax=Daktulosphaira vitifoliae TaxID=58002 RepID=UPI0021AAB207|nr:uncharacterized protein LOC126897320 [Daktulosphaira vitifoliae]
MSLGRSSHAVAVDDMSSVMVITGGSSVPSRIFALFLLITTFQSGHAFCYFPSHYQGSYVMQSIFDDNSHSQPIRYLKVNITEYEIPIWGRCEKRVGSNNYILVDDSVKDAPCIRCVNLKLRTPNVMRVHTAVGPEKCYMQQKDAEDTCISENDLRYNDELKDIILYKTKEASGADARRDYCPFVGQYSVRYKLNDGSGKPASECSSYNSRMFNCPKTHQINIRLNNCSSDDREFVYECLANWEGPGKQHYLALRIGDDRPMYRCALYEEVSPGVIHMSLSSDSTCTTDLKNASLGYETFTFTAKPSPPLPLQYRNKACRFPDWAQGSWQNLRVEGNTVIYKDTDKFLTYTWRCVESSATNKAKDKFLVYGQTQCGVDAHNCILLKKRGPNVLEFIIGTFSSDTFNETLCADPNFFTSNWKTQGRTDGAQVSHCPIMGDYTGVLPDIDGLCAELASNCNAPETMHYTVSDCSNTQIYEGYQRSNKRRIRNIPSTEKSASASSSEYRYDSTMSWTMSESTSSWPSTVPTTFSSTTSISQSSQTQAKNITSSSTESTYSPPTTSEKPSSFSTQTSMNSKTNYSKDKDSRLPLQTTVIPFISSTITINETTKNRMLNTQQSSSYPSLQQINIDLTTPNSSNTWFGSSTTQIISSNEMTSGQTKDLNTTTRPNLGEFKSSDNRQMSDFNGLSQTTQSYSTGIDSSSYRPWSMNWQHQNIYPNGYQTSRQYPAQATPFHLNPTYNYPIATQSRDRYQQISPDHSGQIPSQNFEFQYRNEQPFYRSSGSPPNYYSGATQQNTYNTNPTTYYNFQNGYQTQSDNPYQPFSGSNDNYQRGVMAERPNVDRRTEVNESPLMPFQNYQSFDSRSMNNNQGEYFPPGIFTTTQRYYNQNVTTNNNNYYQNSNRNGKDQILRSDPMSVHNYYWTSTTISGERKTPIALPPIQLPSQNFEFRTSQMSPRPIFSLKHHHEERDYQCLGQWEENGLTYTYTHRTDADVYECFVGSIMNDGKLKLTEAGRHCDRTVDPRKTGMTLTKKGVCDTSKKLRDGSTSFVPIASTLGPPVFQSSTQRTSYTPVPKRLPASTVKPWKAITGMPPSKNRNMSQSNSSKMTYNAVLAVIILIITQILNLQRS